jgi:hypothetical protein
MPAGEAGVCFSPFRKGRLAGWKMVRVLLHEDQSRQASQFAPTQEDQLNGPMVGKQVLFRTYAHISLLPNLPEGDRRRIEEAVHVSGINAGHHFHVARIDREHDEVALLSYPTFYDELFPGLLASWRVHLPTKTVRFRDYSNSLNPPILHRKELMLPASDPAQGPLVAVKDFLDSGLMVTGRITPQVSRGPHRTHGVLPPAA